ncbi:MAG: acyl-[acyl-carrier-protein]--UDP-N-acetylglucosamine O-acyltransferase [Elusimicrobia bacterium RIFOXYA2_FULL_50_26]|nr:MAG: acyl-[acyl-carrier-protein]--UDP-N-acetylglucosamine O-acyltransferase [Elusimicrobia bacterium RIFOXYA2_FULL_50_26]
MIHSTAIIHKSAHIADDVEIGPYAVIGDGTVIAKGCTVGPHALVEFTEIGENCRIHGHAAVGTPPQDLKYKGERTKLILGAGTTVREFAQLNRGTEASGRTIIGNDCLIMAFAHVAHDCIIGNNVIIVNSTAIGGHAEIGDNAVLGGLAAVHQFTRVGKLAMVGGGTMVTLDIMPFAQAQGDRAKLFGLNLVGLKRKGFAPNVIEEIKSAYRILFTSGLPQDEALDQLEATGPGKEVREMIEFIHNSKRGVCRPARKEAAEE